MYKNIAILDKKIIAGADAVQVVSSLYKNGPNYLKEMINRVEKWKASKRYTQLSNFKGKMSQDRGQDLSIYKRAQFMRYFGGKKNIKYKIGVT